jgi:hypothetical protein
VGQVGKDDFEIGPLYCTRIELRDRSSCGTDDLSWEKSYGAIRDKGKRSVYPNSLFSV